VLPYSATEGQAAFACQQPSPALTAEQRADLQTPLEQSLARVHRKLSEHLEHNAPLVEAPPQSTSVSAPLMRPSLHDA
jgi:hypothetical protein